MSNQAVTVKILDKDYQVACPASERDALISAAVHLDERMRDIKTSGNIVGLERIAVMAALNLSHELLQNSGSDNAGQLEGLVNLQLKIDQALEELS